MLWPHGARSAFSLGFDLDGDTIWYNKIKHLPNGPQYLKGRSIGQYGTNKGALRILEILEEYDLKATWFVPALIVEQHGRLIEKILSKGHELSHHGYDHTGAYGDTADAQRAHIERCQDVFMKCAGRRAVGLRPTGALLPQTERWAAEEGGFTYFSGGLSGEACGPYTVEGVATAALNIPCRDEQMDDYVQTVFNAYPQVLPGLPRIAPYQNACANWIREVEGMVRYGNSGSSAFHPQISGTPGRAIVLRQFCRYLAENRDVWVATCQDIALYYRQQAAKEGVSHGQ